MVTGQMASHRISRGMKINAMEARVRFLSALAVSSLAAEEQIHGDLTVITPLGKGCNSMGFISTLCESLSSAVSDIATNGAILPNTIRIHVHLWRGVPLLWAELLEYIQITQADKCKQLLAIRDYFLNEDRTALRFIHLVNSAVQRKNNRFCSVHPYLEQDIIESYQNIQEHSYSPLLVRSIGHMCFLLESIVFSGIWASGRIDSYYFSLGNDLESGNGSNSIAERLIKVAGGKTLYLNSTLPVADFGKAYLGDHISNNLCISNYTLMRESQLCKKPMRAPLQALLNTSRNSYSPNNFSTLSAGIGLLPSLSDFIESTPTGMLVALHHRDSAFTGSGQSWRDSNLLDYSETIDSLISDGFRVVMMNPYPSSHIQALESSSVFNLNGTAFSLWDQLYVLHRAAFLVGTASGISHWWVSSGLPTIMVNTVALPASPIGQGMVHIPKKLEVREVICQLSFNERISLILSLLSSTWDGPVWQYIQVKSYTGSELRKTVYEAIDNFKGTSRPSTCHNLLKSIDIQSTSVPDYFISKTAFSNMHDIFTQILTA